MGLETGFKRIRTGLTFLLVLIPLQAFAIPITYVDTDFEDGLTGGGIGFGAPFGTPSNISSSNLDGRALEFNLNDQMVWNRPASLPSVDTQYVRFDYWADKGANITQFLDIPQILRLDASTAGRHRVELYYDLSAQTAQAFMDGVQDDNLFSILAWNLNPIAGDIRIANQQGAPGLSTGIFQIDNLLWQGNVTIPGVFEPETVFMFLTGLIGLGLTRRNKLK